MTNKLVLFSVAFQLRVLSLFETCQNFGVVKVDVEVAIFFLAFLALFNYGFRRRRSSWLLDDIGPGL